MRRRCHALILAALFACVAAPVVALETDQFTVPDRPLPDLGPELDAYVAGVVWDVALSMNAQAAAHEREARSAAWPLRDYHRSRAARYRSDDFFTRRVYDALAGPGLPECRIEQWVQRHRFRAAADDPRGRTVFEPTLGRCVYGDSLSPFSKPLLLAYLSPTVNLYGSYIGVDKLGHIYQHGYHYYAEYRKAEAEGCDDAKAVTRAIRVGVGQELGVYGETTTGVYSNADLAGNFAGLKFYLNLTHAVRIGDATLPPLLLRHGSGDLYLNPQRDMHGLLKRYVSDHLNEALNPSRFQPLLGNTVRDRLRKRANRLLDFYDTTPQRERERMVELATWHGEKYGHCGFGGVVAIADNCPPPRRSPPRDEAPGVSPAAGAVTAGAASAGSRTAPARLSTR
jgi:hypothetical protein